MIFDFYVSLYSLNTLFTETNFSPHKKNDINQCLTNPVNQCLTNIN